MDYEPEIGQACFGQPWQPQECQEDVQGVLNALNEAWEVARSDDNPFCNTGARFDGEAFRAHAYSWSDDAQPFNFAWRDLRVSWYKYLGRGMSANRSVDRAEALEMLRECMRELLANSNSTGR